MGGRGYVIVGLDGEVGGFNVRTEEGLQGFPIGGCDGDGGGGGALHCDTGTRDAPDAANGQHE